MGPHATFKTIRSVFGVLVVNDPFMLRRVDNRIDYKILATTGKKVEKTLVFTVMRDIFHGSISTSTRGAVNMKAFFNFFTIHGGV